ncbi:MAG: hypothetical protein WBO17_11045, partial [Sphingorhabdus sp.]
KKRLAANIAKSARKERKGERRSRGAVEEKPKDKRRAPIKSVKAPLGKKPTTARKPIVKKAAPRKKP